MLPTIASRSLADVTDTVLAVDDHADSDVATLVVDDQSEVSHAAANVDIAETLLATDDQSDVSLVSAKADVDDVRLYGDDQFDVSPADADAPYCSPTVLQEPLADSVITTPTETCCSRNCSRSRSPRRDHWFQPPSGSLPQPAAELTGDDLQMDSLDVIMKEYNRPTPPETPETVRDSQNTDDEDPMDHRKRYAPIHQPHKPQHWSMTQQFWTNVQNLLVLCNGTYWYDGIIDYTASATSRPLNFEKCLQHAAEFIRSTVQNGGYYKIGITGHPHQRWTRKDCPYEGDPHGFTKMTILYVAEFSNKKLPDSTGRMEVELVKIFNRATDDMCINREGSGGDTPPRGSPQFCYVVS
jgi:hypothetical protein